MTLFYDRNGQLIGAMEWARLCADFEYKAVRKSFVLIENSPFLVSTAWLGLDEDSSGLGPPLIFETMVFDENEDSRGGIQERYATESEAIAGHDAIVAELSTKQ